MRKDILISGFGGQGVLFLGQLLAFAAMQEGKNVVWSPSYGPEMRGGQAHCTVIVSDEPIGSPVVNQADILLTLDNPSLARFEPRLKKGGLVFLNSSLVKDSLSRDDIICYQIPANTLAEQAGSIRSANMVLLGALIKVVPLVGRAYVSQALCRLSKEEHIKVNEAALELGYSSI